MSLRRLASVRSWSVPFALALALAACGDDPVEVEFQVIEEVEFDPSLGIDLSQMDVTPNGIYRLDTTEGTGEALVFGDAAFVDHTGWLNDATQFSAGKFDFTMGSNEVIRGFEDGILGMREEGTRLIIVPPNLAYGGTPPPGSGIPPGSILVFEVTLDSIGS